MITIIISILGIIMAAAAIYFIYRLNIYISTIEDKLQKQIELTENLQQSLKEIIAEDYLQNDGRLKKFLYQKERNSIYNGAVIEENMTI